MTFNLSIAAAGIIFGFLIATAYGAGFHFIVGGPARHIGLYLFVAWVGFAVGHFVGDYLDISLLRLGVIRLFPASLGAWIGLITSRWLTRSEFSPPSPTPASMPAPTPTSTQAPTPTPPSTPPDETEQEPSAN